VEAPDRSTASKALRIAPRMKSRERAILKRNANDLGELAFYDTDKGSARFRAPFVFRLSACKSAAEIANSIAGNPRLAIRKRAVEIACPDARAASSRMALVVNVLAMDAQGNARAVPDNRFDFQGKGIISR
jgi:hypothetical protein